MAGQGEGRGKRKGLDRRTMPGRGPNAVVLRRSYEDEGWMDGVRENYVAMNYVDNSAVLTNFFHHFFSFPSVRQILVNIGCQFLY